jgi:hypothetical protein
MEHFIDVEYENIFNNYDILSIILTFCGIPEKLNFHRINNTCKLLMIKCYFCKKEPILPIILVSFTKNYNHINNYSCLECFKNTTSNQTNKCFKNITDEDKILWKKLDTLNMITYKSKNKFRQQQQHQKCYINCNNCKMRCFNSSWLYHHKTNNCFNNKIMFTNIWKYY